MVEFRSILLASHGTIGAQAAERAAFALIAPGGALHHVIVVPDFWRGMLGDDWLNNAASQIRFGRHVEGELQREIDAHVERMEGECQARGLTYACRHSIGKPADELLDAARLVAHDLVVIGSPRPRGAPGFRLRMAVESLTPALGAPLYIVPHPDR